MRVLTTRQGRYSYVYLDRSVEGFLDFLSSFLFQLVPIALDVHSFRRINIMLFEKNFKSHCGGVSIDNLGAKFFFKKKKKKKKIVGAKKKKIGVKFYYYYFFRF
jgi:hypothetical protein